MRPKLLQNMPDRVPMTWEVRNAAEGEVDLFIYGDIIDEADRWWYDEAEMPASVVSIEKALQDAAAAQSIKQVNLYVASYGGDFAQGLAISSVLQRFPAPVHAHIDGFAASAATLAFSRADLVTAPSNAMLLYHPPLLGLRGYFNAADLQELIDYLARFMPMMLESYKAKSNMSDEELSAFLARDEWISAQEALDLGFIDAITEPVALAARARDVLAACQTPLPEPLEAALAKGVEVLDDAERQALADEAEASTRAVSEALSGLSCSPPV